MARKVFIAVLCIFMVQVSIAGLAGSKGRPGLPGLQSHQRISTNSDGSKGRPGLPGLQPDVRISTNSDVLKGIPSERETATKMSENLPFLKPKVHPGLPVPPGPPRNLNNDVVFIIDDSGSITSQGFQTSLATLGQMIDKALATTKYAAIKFSNRASLLFQFVPPREAKLLLQGATFTGGATNTQEALRMARTYLFLNPNAGQCPNTRKVAVVLTDGMSNIHKHQTIRQANALKAAGVKVFVIAVGSYTDAGLQEMIGICSFPYQLHFYRVQDITSLRNVVSHIPN